MMRTALLLAATLFAQACCPNPAAQRNPVESKLGAPPDIGHASDDQKTLYTVGIAVGRSATTLELSTAELRFVLAGIEDQVAGRPAQVSIETYAPKVEQFAKRRTSETVAKREAEGKAAIEAAAKEKGAVTAKSGLVLRTLKPGSGARPSYTDKVRVHYRGTFANGVLFDSDTEGEPVELELAGTIPCWAEALQEMKIGERAKLVCPPKLAYGDDGRPPAMPGHATLIFEIELVSAEPSKEKAGPDDKVPLDLRAP